MRMLTVADYRRIMGFPDDYVLPKVRTKAIHLLGNAVPPPMAEYVWARCLPVLAQTSRRRQLENLHSRQAFRRFATLPSRPTGRKQKRRLTLAPWSDGGICGASSSSIQEGECSSMKVTLFVAGALVGYALGFATPTLIRSAVENENMPTGSSRDQTRTLQRLDDLPNPEPCRDSQRTSDSCLLTWTIATPSYESIRR
jgi:hypothetical protein